MQKTDYEKRNKDIRKWRKEKISQIEIARRLKITRQRVQQIERKLGLGLRCTPGVYKVYTFICRWCERKATLRIAGRIYCCRKCFFMSRKIHRTPQEIEQRKLDKKEKNRLRSRKYYYEVLKKKDNWKEIIKKRNEHYARKNS